VDALQTSANRTVKHGYGALDNLLIDLAPAHGETIAHCVRQMRAGCLDAGQQLLAGANNELGRCRWCWRTEIGDEIRDCHIRFVPDGGYYRSVAGADGARPCLLIEGPQVCKRAAATGKNHQVGPTRTAEV